MKVSLLRKILPNFLRVPAIIFLRKTGTSTWFQNKLYAYEATTLKKNFKTSFGSTLRVYNGVKFAEDDDTVGKIAKETVSRGSEVKANGHTKISTFEKAMKDTYGIKVQIANSKDTDLLDNDLTLTASGKA